MKFLDLTIDQYCEDHIDREVDIVTALDVLEHLPRSKAFDVIDQMLYHCKFMIIIWPISHPSTPLVTPSTLIDPLLKPEILCKLLK